MEPRTYRHWVEGKDLLAFNVTVKETDLYIRATSNLKRKAQRLALKFRNQLERYIEKNPEFLVSLEPLLIPSNAPQIVKEMSQAAQAAEVGPMAAVAGAIAEFIGKGLLEFSQEIIVENGGDIYLKSLTKRTVGIYAGKSPLTGKIGLEIEAKDTPLGICTSSGTVGHSLSFGKADAVVVTSQSAAVADAAATAIGNLIKEPSDIDRGIDLAQSITGLFGVLIIKDDKLGAWGGVKICQITN